MLVRKKCREYQELFLFIRRIIYVDVEFEDEYLCHITVPLSSTRFFWASCSVSALQSLLNFIRTMCLTGIAPFARNFNKINTQLTTLKKQFDRWSRVFRVVWPAAGASSVKINILWANRLILWQEGNFIESLVYQKDCETKLYLRISKWLIWRY
jgi:hypothetical protein